MQRSAMGFATWLLGTSAAALFVLAGLALKDAVHVRDVMANGVEATALVEGGGAILDRQSGPFSADLVWQDTHGSVRRAAGQRINEALARQLVAHGAGEPASVLIRYLPDAPGTAPVIASQAALDQEDSRFRMLAGTAGGALCAFGAAILAWLNRRRRASRSA